MQFDKKTNSFIPSQRELNTPYMQALVSARKARPSSEPLNQNDNGADMRGQGINPAYTSSYDFASSYGSDSAGAYSGLHASSDFAQEGGKKGKKAKADKSLAISSSKRTVVVIIIAVLLLALVAVFAMDFAMDEPMLGIFKYEFGEELATITGIEDPIIIGAEDPILGIIDNFRGMEEEPILGGEERFFSRYAQSIMDNEDAEFMDTLNVYMLPSALLLLFLTAIVGLVKAFIAIFGKKTRGFKLLFLLLLIFAIISAVGMYLVAGYGMEDNVDIMDFLTGAEDTLSLAMGAYAIIAIPIVGLILSFFASRKGERRVKKGQETLADMPYEGEQY
ncbi:MAG: hypothetical protein FWD49_02090 [Firmicutes bacterium]|nr:hypothetical protein [Bacillota bacterium]